MPLTVDEICEIALRSKKYSRMYAPVVRRICREEYPKHEKDSDRVKAVKTKLHALYGAFAREGSNARVGGLLDGVKNGDDLRHVSAEILKLHASTEERSAYVTEFYKYIFNRMDCSKLLDICCGYNPFSLPFMPEKPAEYRAADIDADAAPLINRYFKIQGLPALCECADIADETPKHRAGAAFVFKTLPVLESQRAGRGFELLEEIDADRIAVTYPLRSLGGREKGMGVNYAASFERSAEGRFAIADKTVIGNELIYII